MFLAWDRVQCSRVNRALGPRHHGAWVGPSNTFLRVLPRQLSLCRGGEQHTLRPTMSSPASSLGIAMGDTIQPIFSLLSRHLSLGGYDGQAVCTTGLSSAECSAAHLVRYFFSDMTGGVSLQPPAHPLSLW